MHFKKNITNIPCIQVLALMLLGVALHSAQDTKVFKTEFGGNIWASIDRSKNYWYDENKKCWNLKMNCECNSNAKNFKKIKASGVFDGDSGPCAEGYTIEYCELVEKHNGGKAVGKGKAGSKSKGKGRGGSKLLESSGSTDVGSSAGSSRRVTTPGKMDNDTDTKDVLDKTTGKLEATRELADKKIDVTAAGDNSSDRKGSDFFDYDDAAKSGAPAGAEDTDFPKSEIHEGGIPSAKPAAESGQVDSDSNPNPEGSAGSPSRKGSSPVSEVVETATVGGPGATPEVAPEVSATTGDPTSILPAEDAPYHEALEEAKPASEVTLEEDSIHVDDDTKAASSEAKSYLGVFSVVSKKVSESIPTHAHSLPLSEVAADDNSAEQLASSESKVVGSGGASVDGVPVSLTPTFSVVPKTLAFSGGAAVTPPGDAVIPAHGSDPDGGAFDMKNCASLGSHVLRGLDSSSSVLAIAAVSSDTLLGASSTTLWPVFAPGSASPLSAVVPTTSSEPTALVEGLGEKALLAGSKPFLAGPGGSSSPTHGAPGATVVPSDSALSGTPLPTTGLGGGSSTAPITGDGSEVSPSVTPQGSGVAPSTTPSGVSSAPTTGSTDVPGAFSTKKSKRAATAKANLADKSPAKAGTNPKAVQGAAAKTPNTSVTQGASSLGANLSGILTNVSELGTKLANASSEEDKKKLIQSADPVIVDIHKKKESIKKATTASELVNELPPKVQDAVVEQVVASVGSIMSPITEVTSFVSKILPFEISLPEGVKSAIRSLTLSALKNDSTFIDSCWPKNDENMAYKATLLPVRAVKSIFYFPAAFAYKSFLNYWCSSIVKAFKI